MCWSCAEPRCIYSNTTSPSRAMYQVAPVKSPHNQTSALKSNLLLQLPPHTFTAMLSCLRERLLCAVMMFSVRWPQRRKKRSTFLTPCYERAHSIPGLCVGPTTFASLINCNPTIQSCKVTRQNRPPAGRP